MLCYEFTNYVDEIRAREFLVSGAYHKAERAMLGYGNKYIV